MKRHETVFNLMVLPELLVFFSGELVLLGHGWALTSIGHHDFLDWSIFSLRGRVSEAGEDARPPHSQQAEAASDCNVPHHPKGKRKKMFNIHNVSIHSPNLTAISEGKSETY